MEERDNYSLLVEADEVIKEIQYAVKFIEISQILQNADDEVHINMETKENRKFCVELSPRGFRIIGHKFDEESIPVEESRHFETIYSLLDSISLGYRDAFSNALADKLKGLQNIPENT